MSLRLGLGRQKLKWMSDHQLLTDPDDVALTNWDVGIAPGSYVNGTWNVHKGDPSPGLSVTFTFRRVWTFHLMQTLLPSVLIMVGSVLSVFVRSRHVPARMALCITNFLSMVALFNGAR